MGGLGNRPYSRVATFGYPAIGVIASLSVLRAGSGARPPHLARTDLRFGSVGSSMATFGDIWPAGTPDG